MSNTTRIDSHQHFWNYSQEEYPWIPIGSALAHDFGPNELKMACQGTGITGCVVVQARQSLEETRWLLELADQFPIILGVVGWVDLQSEQVEDQISRFEKHPKLVGVRHVVQDETDPNFLLRPNFLRGIESLAKFDLAYDLLVKPHQLATSIELVKKFPEQRFVVDHLAKPFIKDQRLSPWQAEIEQISQFPNVFCKLSGMVTEADHGAWTEDDLQPYIETVWKCFGPERLMFGSDWPVALLAAPYDRVFGVIKKFLATKSESERDQVLGGTAQVFYRLKT